MHRRILIPLIALGALGALVAVWQFQPDSSSAPGDTTARGVLDATFTSEAIYLIEGDAEETWLVRLVPANRTRTAEMPIAPGAKLIGASKHQVWLVTAEGRLEGRSPQTLRVEITGDDFAVKYPQLTEGLAQSERLGMVRNTGALWLPPTSSTRQPTLITADLAPPVPFKGGLAEVRQPRPKGSHAPVAVLKNSLRIEFLNTPNGRDRVPSMISGSGESIRMNARLNFPEGGFVSDDATGTPIAIANPPSVLVVSNEGKRLTRLSLAGTELWSREVSSSAGDNPKWGPGTWVASQLVMTMGNRLVGIDADSGEVMWQY